MILKIKDLSYSYKKLGVTLSGINVDFELGRSYALIRGCDRIETILLGLLVKSDMNYDGLIEYDGTSIREVSSDYYRRDCVNLVLKSGSLFGKMNALENILIRGRGSRNVVFDLLDFIGFDRKLLGVKTRDLELLDKFRVVLVKALYYDYKVVLIDGLLDLVDDIEIGEVGDLLRLVSVEKKITVILATNCNKLANLCYHKFVFSNNQLLQVK